MRTFAVAAARYTATEAKLLTALRAGEQRRESLHALLPDDLGAASNLRAHLTNIRKKLPKSQTIECVIRGRHVYYRIARV